MKTSILVWNLLLLTAALVACQAAPPEVTPTPTLDLARTARAETETAADQQATAEVQASLDQLGTTEAQETEQAAASAAARATSEAESTATKAAINATATFNAETTQEARVTGTAEARASATAQAEPIRAIVEDLNDRGYLDSTSGAHIRLTEFHESWAQLDWYRLYPTGLDPDDFVLRADVSWRSASTTANWWTSGCGFVFREKGIENHYLAYLGLDGYVNMVRQVNNIPASLGRSYYGPVDTPAGEAEIMLVVSGDTFTFFVNGEDVHRRTDGALGSGNLSFTLVSGTNKDYGTRCDMENVDLWIIE